MSKKRTVRLNSLLKEVISEVITRDVKDPRLGPLISVTSVNVTDDLSHATVYISVIGDQLTKEKTLEALHSGAGFIAIHASKKVVMRYFPSLTFKLDDSANKLAHIDSILHKIHQEQQNRPLIDDTIPST